MSVGTPELFLTEFRLAAERRWLGPVLWAGEVVVQ